MARQVSPCRQPLPDSMVLAAALFMVFWFGRAVLPVEDPPAFAVASSAGIWVELGSGFREPGMRQYFAEIAPMDVMELTQAQRVISKDLARPDWHKALENGERLDLRLDDGNITEFKRSWMSAWARLALGVPLHPDRMTQEDWSALPGIGKTLALRIEQERQRSGDFGDLEALQRVPGIGPKRISAWQEYFSEI